MCERKVQDCVTAPRFELTPQCYEVSRLRTEPPGRPVDIGYWMWRMSGLTQDGPVEPVSRGQFLRRERGQGNIHFPCSADHEQDYSSSNHTRLLNVQSVHVRFWSHTTKHFVQVRCLDKTAPLFFSSLHVSWQTFFFCSLFPVQQTTSGISHRVK